MATMIPPYINKDVKSNAEKKIFQIIKDDKFLDDWYCIHSLGLSRHDNQVEGELDFVLIGSAGIFALEVKGGRISRENGVWQFIDRYGNIHKKSKGPFQQVHDSLFSLRNSFITKFGNNIYNYLFGYGVVFPDISFNITSPEWDNEMVYDLRDRFSLFSDYVKRLISYWEEKTGEKRRLGNHEINKFVNYMRGDFEKLKSMDVVLDNIEEKIITLTEQQYKALDRMGTNKRVLFSGTAGTGKTLLAIENARRQAMIGKKVIIFCFNKVLAAKIKFLVSKFELSKNIKVESLHRYMYKKIVNAGLDKYISGSIEDDTLYKRLYPEYFIESISTINFEPFDYLIVDEGQDILSFDYFVVLDYLINGGLEKGEWSIFFDPNKQSGLYQEYSQDLVDNLKEFGAAEYKLDVNCRNTLQIAKQTSVITNFMVERNDIEGEKVKLRWYKNEDEFIFKLKKVLNKIKRQGISLEDVTILFPDKRKYYIELIKNLPFDILEINDENVGNLPEGKISCSTVQSYKGMENKVIIYIGLENFADRWYRVVNYIGMTRAKEILYIFIKDKLSKDYLEKMSVFMELNK